MLGMLLGSLIATLLLCTILTSYLWPYRRATLSRLIIFTQVCYILWCISLLASMVLETLPEKAFATQVRQLLLPLLVPTWFMISVALFLPQIWRRIGRWRFVVYVFPLVVIFVNLLGMAGVPGAQKLMFYDFQMMPGMGELPTFKRGLLLRCSLTYGLFWMFMQYVVYTYSAIRYRGSRRVHALCIFGAGLLPILLEILGLSLYEDSRFTQLTVAAMWPSIIALYYAVSRLELLSVTALAKEKIFEELPGPVFILNPQGELWDANRNALVQLGLEQTFLGRQGRDIPVVAGIMSAAAGSGFYELGGHSYQIETRELTLRDEDVKAHVFALMDVTDLEQSNRTLREMNQEVLQLARFNSRVQSVLSHDLAGSLAGVQLLLKSVQNQSVSDAMKNVIEANQASIDLLKSLLSWSENEGQRQKVSLRDRVCAAIEQVTPQTLANRISIRLDFPKGEFSVQGSGMVVEAIVRNLLSNAVRYSPVESEIVVSGEVEAASVRLSISDQGGGIPEDILRLLKDPSFKRIPSERGFGLGLKMTSDLIAQMGGSLDFQVQEGSGTRVQVQLPLFD